MSAWDTSVGATVERLRRVYACRSNDEVCAVYGVKKWDSGTWHREQDERALARQFIADWDEKAKREAARVPHETGEDDPDIHGY